MSYTSVATYTCMMGYWDPKGPDMSNCTSPWTNHITQRMRSGETAAIVARELAEQTKVELRPGDVPSTVKAMAQLVELLDVQLRNLTPGGKDTAARSLNKLQKRERSCRFFLQAMVETVNNLLEVHSQAAWKALAVSEQLRCATMLLDTVETGAFMLADNLLKTDTIQESAKNIQLEVARLSTDGNLVDLSFPQSESSGNSIHLSANTLKQHGRNGEIRMALVLYKNLGQYLSTENASVRLSSEAAYPNYSLIVNSPVITAAINKDSNKVYLSEPVVFTVRHLQQSEENFNPNCSFWSYSKRTMTGYWSTQDCRLLGSNRTHTSCSCTHLTNFAVLMAHVEVKKADQMQKLLLDLITWVGILLSLVCLLICIFTFCFFRGLQSDRNTIHKNLCISLFIAETLFLTGIHRTDQPVRNNIQYIYSSGKKFETLKNYSNQVTGRKLLHFISLTLSYSVSLHLSITLCLLFSSLYISLSFSRSFSYSLALTPSLSVHLSFPLTVSLSLSYYISHLSIHPSPSLFFSLIVSWVIGDIALLCLLGLTWAFGLMYINENTMIMAYLFTIFNSLQSMFIFIFHCVLQKKVRKEYGRCLRTHCCSGKSVESTISTSTKTSTARTPGRYSTNSQSRIRRMWNDTVRKQSESSFITGDINSSATLNREGMLNNARDSSVMDTLPLNGNHGSSYGMAAGDYLTYSSRGSEPPTTLEKKILKELTANYTAPYMTAPERQGNPSAKLSNHMANGGVPKDDVMVLDNPGAFHRHDDSGGGGLSLEIIREESQAPLLPPRPPPPDGHAPPTLHTFSTHRRLPQENSESFFPLLPNETQNALRDSIYTSMPTLTDLPRGVVGDADDVYYKSMPNLGSRNHIQELQSYYQMGRGGSDGFIAPPEKDESSPEEQPQDPSHLVTSL
uniref:Adhesion G protein-coupled receptor L3.1 n=1 Tax=Astyanax mexicanus TaxID=7994 RepID=A0A8B9H1Z1_ASTMX